jgi:hypothetical protein
VDDALMERKISELVNLSFSLYKEMVIWRVQDK